MKNIVNVIIFVQAVASGICLIIGAITGNFSVIGIGAGGLIFSSGIALMKYAAELMS